MMQNKNDKYSIQINDTPQSYMNEQPRSDQYEWYYEQQVSQPGMVWHKIQVYGLLWLLLLVDMVFCSYIFVCHCNYMLKDCLVSYIPAQAIMLFLHVFLFCCDIFRIIATIRMAQFRRNAYAEMEIINFISIMIYMAISVTMCFCGWEMGYKWVIRDFGYPWFFLGALWIPLSIINFIYYSKREQLFDR